MSDLVVGLVVGLLAAVLLMGLVQAFLLRRLAARYENRVRRYDQSIVDLRQERAEDKETNRKLRRDLIANSPQRLVESVRLAEQERDSAITERDQAVEQLDLVQRDLTLASGRLNDREAKLREYGKALKEIRLSLESQDHAGTINATVTDEVPASAVRDAGPKDLSSMPDTPGPPDISQVNPEPETADVSAAE